MNDNGSKDYSLFRIAVYLEQEKVVDFQQMSDMDT